MSQNPGIGDRVFLERLFYDYSNREFALMVGSEMFRVPLEPQTKLLFCKLDLGPLDIHYSQTSIREQKQDKKLVSDWLLKKYGVKTVYDAFLHDVEI